MSTPVESVATDESTSSGQMTVEPETVAMAATPDEAPPETPKTAIPVGSADATPSATSQPPQDSASVDESSLPDFQRLAYVPDQPTSLLELPGEFWVVQLMAVSSKEFLEAYAEEHDLRGLSAARIASGDRLFYVLILGIYETMDRAQQAISTLPPPYNSYKPLLRTLASLQQAMRKADEITGGLLSDPS